MTELDSFHITSSARIAWLRANCDPGAASPPETVARVAMRGAGLEVESQVTMQGVGRTDFVVEGVLVVEIDGQTYHMNERSFSADRERDRNALIRFRMPTIRFTRLDVERNPAAMAREVVAAVRSVRSLACQSDGTLPGGGGF